MLYAEIQFNRPMKLPSMTRSGTRLTDVYAEPTYAGLVIGRTFVPWMHVLFVHAALPPPLVDALSPFELPIDVPPAFVPAVPPPPGDHLRAPNEGAPVSDSSDKPARRGNSKRAGQPDKP